MSIKRPTSRGQIPDEEAAVQQSYRFESNTSFIDPCLHFAHSCTERAPWLLPSGSEATPHDRTLWGECEQAVHCSIEQLSS